MEKKREPITLRTDLSDAPIDESLRKIQFQNFTEIINKPKKNKRRISFPNLPKLKPKTVTSDSNLTTINYDKFGDVELNVTDASNTSSNSIKSMQNFKSLLDKDFSDYIIPIKKIYPSFKLNHYSKYSEKLKQSDKNDDVIKESSLEYNYTQNTLINRLKLNEFNVQRQSFKVNEDILNLNMNDINAISTVFDNKLGLVEMEIDKVLSSNSAIISNYVQNNLAVGKEINQYIEELNGKKFIKGRLNKHFITNTSRLLLLSSKKNNLLKIISSFHEIKQLKDSLESYHNSGTQITELSDALGSVRAIISKIRIKDKMRKINIVNLAEKELMQNENKNEEKLVEEFGVHVSKFFNLCIAVNSSEASEIEKTVNPKKAENERSFNLKSEEEAIEKYNDYEKYGSKFILIYKNLSNKTVCSLLVSLLEIIDIIIKDNIDIFSITEALEGVFKNLIIKIYDNIQKKENLKQIDILSMLSNAFVIMILNYNYILELFTINCGLTPKIFKDLTNFINTETQKLVKAIASSMIHEIIGLNAEEFFLKVSEIKEESAVFYQYHKIQFEMYNKNIFDEFMLNFFDKENSELIEELTKEDFVPLQKIDRTIQTKVNRISIDCLAENFLKNPSPSDDKEEETDCILLNQSKEKTKHKAIKFTVIMINFIYDNIIIYQSILDDQIRNELISQFYSVIIKLFDKTNDILLNNKTGENKPMTEKEIAYFTSHIIIINYVLAPFLIKHQNEKISKALNEIQSICRDAITQLLNGLSQEIIAEFSELNFEDYPVFKEKDYNSYIKKFSRMKKLYDIMVNSFENEDIIEIFNLQFKMLFNSMDKIVKSKNTIESDPQLKQFRTEMNYIKKLLKLFELISTDTYREKIEEISKNVNPNKIAKKRRRDSTGKPKETDKEKAD